VVQLRATWYADLNLLYHLIPRNSSRAHFTLQCKACTLHGWWVRENCHWKWTTKFFDESPIWEHLGRTVGTNRKIQARSYKLRTLHTLL